MENKLVSIITPMYKGAAFIGETIESVRAQTYRDWEMIIVDDCSPDNGAGIAVVKKYAEQDSRIILIESKENKGASGARNIALRAAKGRYIALLDADDLWPADYLQSQTDFLNASSEHVIAYAATQMVEEHTKEYISTPWHRPLKVSYNAVLCESPICPSATIYDMEKCPRKYFFNEELKSMRDDWVFFLDMLKDIPYAHYNDAVTILYRVRKQATTKIKYKIIPYQWKVLRKVEKVSFFKSVYCMFYWGIRGIIKFYIY